jgi:hypothetical protein
VVSSVALEPRRSEARLVRLARREAGRLAAYRREAGGRALMVVLNFGHEARRCELEHGRTRRVLLSTSLERAGERTSDAIGLHADEGIIVAFD